MFYGQKNVYREIIYNGVTAEPWGHKLSNTFFGTFETLLLPTMAESLLGWLCPSRPFLTAVYFLVRALFERSNSLSSPCPRDTSVIQLVFLIVLFCFVFVF